MKYEMKSTGQEAAGQPAVRPTGVEETVGPSKDSSQPQVRDRTLSPRRRVMTFRQQNLRDKPFKLEEVVTLLEANQSSRDQWYALCPAHGDGNPSLSISGDDENLLLYCHAGCSYEDILRGLRRLRDERLGIKQQKQSSMASSVDASQIIPAPGAPNPVVLVTADGSKFDWAAQAQRYEREVEEKLSVLADGLGVSCEALKALHVGWHEGKKCYTFPEFDGHGRVVGIATRDTNGRKKVIAGGRRGIYIPVGWYDVPGPIYICEGASDTAALVDAQRRAIGRAGASSGLSSLVDLVGLLPKHDEIVVLGENDVKPDGKWPGKEGAEKTASKLAQALERPVRILFPPPGIKDVRAWFASCATETTEADGSNSEGESNGE